MPAIYRSSCSDPLSPEGQERWAQVEAWLCDQGSSLSVLGPGIGPWDDEDWWLVADPTGGSLAKDTLPVLMGALPSVASESALRRAWWSMSDNSLVLNALLDRSQCRILHGHPLTLAGRDAVAQKRRFHLWQTAIRAGLPFPTEALPPAHLLQGSWPDVVTLIGGNLTALERLGETPWRPRPRGRFLLVESLTCAAAHAPQRLSELVEDPWWEGIGGLVLGRFTHADRDAAWIDRALSLLPPDLTVLRLPAVGHGAEGWTVPLGEPIALRAGAPASAVASKG